MIQRYIFEFIMSSYWKVWLWTKCDRCERSRKECVRRDTQDRGSRCKQCVKDHQLCKYTSKSQSKNKSKPPPPKASKSTEEGSSSSSSSHHFELELMQQQLKASQEDLRIAQQQLQLANSRIEAQRNLYEAQLAGYRGQGNGKVKQSHDRRNRVWALNFEVYWFFFICTVKWRISPSLAQIFFLFVLADTFITNSQDLRGWLVPKYECLFAYQEGP